MHYLDPLFLIKTVGLLGVFLIIFAESGLFFGFFLPGDSLLFTAGLLASQGYIHIIPLILLAFLGAVLGDNVGYAFGKRYGAHIWKKEKSLFFNIRYLHQTEDFYKKHGKKTIIVARFIPIIRTFAPIMAGVGKMEYKTFFPYNIIGGLVWTIILPLVGYYLGKSIPSADRYILPIIIAIIIISFIPPLFELARAKMKSDK